MNIKKTIPVAIVVAAIFVLSSALAPAAFAATETVDGIEWTYSVENGEATIGTGEWGDNAIPRNTSGDVAIPSWLGGYPVTAIGECAFYNCYSITSVTIPDGVVSIGRNAFSQCYSLASVTFPESLTSIGGWVFEYSPIQTVSIPAGVSSIGDAAFYRCTSLTEINVSPDNRSYKSIGGVLFDASQKTLLAYPAGKDNASYEIPAGVETIGYEAFHNSNLAFILIPDGVAVIRSGAFSSCMKLQSLTIPASVSVIGEGAFEYATGIQEISVDSDNRRFRIEEGALVEADTLKFFPLGNGVVSYTIPDGIIKIEQRAFYGHQTLETVVIPESVTRLDYLAFYSCPNLKNVEIRGGITSCEWHVFCSNYELTNVVISSGTSVLGGGMFESCRKLETITIPDSVTSVGDGIFTGCSGLASVLIPYALKDDISDWGLPDSCEVVVRDKIPLEVLDWPTPILTNEERFFPIARGGLQPYSFMIWRNGSFFVENNGNEQRWSPGEYDLGTSVFTVRVTDAEGTSVEKTFNVSVKKNPNERPVIDLATPSSGDFTLASGETVTFSVSAHDPNGDALSYNWYGYWYDDEGEYHNLGISHFGSSFDFSRPVGEEGIFYVGCEVSDGRLSSYSEWRISVRDIPVVETAELPEATEGTAYSTTLAAHGGVAPYAWAVASSGYAERTQASTFAMIGDAQGWNDDDGCWTLDLPFAFPFYGGTYTKVRVNSNGTLNFDNSYFSNYSYSESAFLAHPMIAVLWKDLSTDDGDIYVKSSLESVTISWRCDYLDGGAVNASATLYPDGRIVLSYGAGNANGGFIGISKGDGAKKTISARSEAGSMSNAGDIVFIPVALPDGLALSGGGVLSGTVDEPGEYTFEVSVTDDAGETVTKSFSLTVAENGAFRPGFAAVAPEAGYVNMGAETERTFAVKTTHPAGGAVSLEWFLDGESAGTGVTYAYTRTDDELHALRLVASATDLPKTAVREWKVGTLTVSDPESTTVSYGMKATFSVEVVSSLNAVVTWFDDETDEELGTGETLTLRHVTATRDVKAIVESTLGAVTSAVATVTVDPSSAVGRIYKMTGPAFVGNRLVLRAKTYGDPTGATFAWKRDGVTVATTERLDIAALAKSDFGTYTFTMANSHGSATTEPFVLAEAPAGVPVGWGADDHGRTTAPEGLTGVAQVASGMNFNLGLKTDGTVAAWGYNGHGGCDVPEGLSGVSFVAAGGYNSQGAGFAVKTDGSVVAWGQPAEIDGYWNWRWVDDYDEYGSWIGEHKEYFWYGYTNGWDTVSTMPAGLSDVVKVAVGGEFAIVLKADGTVVTWGMEDEWSDWNWNVAVPSYVADVVDIAAGNDFAMVLLADGTAFPFGPDFDVLGSDSMAAWTFDDAVGIGANKNSWTKAVWAIQEDGWAPGTTRDDYNQLADSPYSEAGFVAVDAGQYHAMALDNDGKVFVWGGTWYDQDRIPAAVPGNAVGIAAGGYHCTAILPDTDGDSISDAEERLLGRDPALYEDYRRIEVSGRVSVSGSDPASNAVVRLYDAAGTVRAAAQTDENGAYVLSGIIPGNYFLKIEAAGAVDIWQDGLRPSLDGQAPFPVVVGGRDDADFDLEPGQAPALVQTVLTSTADDGDGEYAVEDPPSEDTVIYLDMWPTETVKGAEYPGLIDIGEVAASHSDCLPHKITLRPASGDMKAVPAPVELDGVEGETVEAKFERNPETGSVTIVTEPAGAEIWIDYADQSLGVTPLTVDNLAAASHALLLRKDGYLQPRPIQFSVNSEGTTEVTVPLTAETEPAMSAVVSSAIPGMPIYIDYLPSDKVTPALVEGLDPASHAGSGWFSASHSILLRHPALSPFAPRAVPEWEVDPVTDDPIVPDEPPALHIDAPNTYEWDASDRADFGVSIIEIPEILYCGGTAMVRWSVTNAGAVAAVAPWKERVFLVNDAGLTMVAEVTVSSALDAGASAVRTATFDIPADLAQSGDTRVRVEIDPDGAVLQVLGGLADSATSSTIPLALPDPVRLLFDANGGIGDMTGLSVVPGITTNLPACGFSRPGYGFAGWATSRGGSVAYSDGASVTPSSDMTLYAGWTANTYIVTLDRQGGSGGSASVTATYGSPMPKISVPTKSGCTFNGYWTEPDGEGTQYYTASGASARDWDGLEDAPLCAYWTKTISSIAISGPATVASAGTETYTCTATYSDKSTATVAAEWSLSAGGAYGSIDPATGVFTALSASAKRTVTVKATFGGKSATKTVTVSGRTLSSIAISGPGQIESLEFAEYVCTATYSDGTDETVSASWAITAGGAYASVENATGVVMSLNEGRTDQTATLRATFGGKTADLAITLPAQEPATTHYVDAANGSDANDGLDWTSAKRTIQSAIGSSAKGDLILVAKGAYEPIDATGKRLEICAVSDAEATVIDGDGESRCATLDARAVLSGFILRNGVADFGGGALGGILEDCVIENCAAVADDEGLGGLGGGAYGSALSRCVVTNCTADVDGGGLYECAAENAVIAFCEADGLGGGAYHSTLTGCTVYGCGATTGAGVAGCTVQNSIVWENRLYAVDKKGVRKLGNCANVMDGKKTLYKNTCTYTDSSPKPAGSGNLAKDPLFVDAANGDFRLQYASPVKNKGSAKLAVGDFDLGGRPRQIGAPDMGAHELADGTPVPADYDGDGVTDAAYFDDATATWIIMQSRDGPRGAVFGDVKATPVPADYDGDGRADFATYLATAKVPAFRIQTQLGEEREIALGEKGATPFAVDIDGDGIADPGVFQGNAKKPSFTVLQSTRGWSTAAEDVFTLVFGTKGAKAVVGDFDGDGLADFGCYTSTASKPTFSVALSREGWNATSPLAKALGAKSSEPCCGDFDGDGITDFAAYSGTAKAPLLYRMFSTSKWREVRTLPFGEKGSRAAICDWDGDGAADVAIEFRGRWWYVTRGWEVGEVPAP